MVLQSSFSGHLRVEGRRTQHWLRLDQEAHLIRSCSSVQSVASPTSNRDRVKQPEICNFDLGPEMEFLLSYAE